MPSTSSALRKIDIVVLAIVIALGIWLRIPAETFAPGEPLHALQISHPQPAFKKIGFDEGLYREYVNALIKHGINSYPDVFATYIAAQQKLPGSILPPARFLYIFTAYVWHLLFGCEALQALHQVAAFFSVLTLGLATAFAWHLRGPAWALGIAALMAVAPTQLHMSQHALVDGFFAFWALLVLWLLWENLQVTRTLLGVPSPQSSPPGRGGREASGAGKKADVDRRWIWLVAYVLALALLVLTKENSFFVWIAILVLLIANRWLQFGTVTRELVVATILGPLLGVVVLVFLAGGVDVLLQSYQLSVGKNFQLRYAILTGDGPWYRYIVDLLLVSPLIVILAFGAIFRLDRTKKPELFLSIFIAASYLVMCNVKYGMNLRYTNMWDMPLRFLVLSALVSLTTPLRRFRIWVLVVAVALICAIELHQYIVLAVQFPLYELVPEGLLRALRILKAP